MTDFPDGSLPYGYHILAGYPVENDTEEGLEATVVYVGPAEDRWLFLEEIFGRWETDGFSEEDPETEETNYYCCARLAKEPMRYRLNSNREEEGEIVLYDHLWPDRFSIRPVSNPTPLIGNSTPEASLELVERSLSYDCVCEITVNYRSKCHAGWPTWLYPDCIKAGYHPYGQTSFDECFWMPPVDYSGETPVEGNIADGTFIKVTRDTKVEMQTIPGRHLRFRTSEGTWPETNPRNDLQQDINYPVKIITTNLDVEWSNLPLIPEDAIIECRGKLNSHPFLGNPIGSVLLLGAEVVTKIPFYNRWSVTDLKKSAELHTVTYHFLVQTVDGIHTTPDNPLTCFTQMGYFNRRWCPWKIDNTSNNTSSPFRLVEDKHGNLPYGSADFNSLFMLQMCPVEE